MRAFLLVFHPFRLPGGSRLGAGLLAAAIAAALLAGPGSASSQWPGEVRGRVVDESTGRPVSGAAVVVASGARAETDAAGRFHLRGLEPGSLRLRVSRLGYAEFIAAVEVENGAVARPVIELVPTPLPVREIRAEGRRSRDPSVTVLDRSELSRPGARTAADALASVPGVSVRGRGPGGARTVSVRGSDPDEVLVLLDGAPLNDPVTGEADLTAVPVASLERMTVLSGARSARFGSRAQAGAILLESRAARVPTGGGLRAGSLERVAVDLGGGGSLGDVRLGGTATAEDADGGFDFHRPQEVGGGSDHRENAEVTRLGAQGSLDVRTGGGELAVRVGGEALERGIPGKSFVPSDSATQEMLRGRASARWRGPGPVGLLRASTHVTAQRLRFRDPAPPLGTPFSDRTELERGGIRLELEGDPGPAWLGTTSAGVEADHLRVRSDVLSAAGAAARTDLAAWGRAGARLSRMAGAPAIHGALRLDRAGRTGELRASHDLTLSLRPAGIAVHVSHRSAFSPPTLGDQFFREGVGVRPNPDLRAERVPSEIEAGAAWAGTLDGVEVDAGVTGYRADVDDMIVWAPDFRFVWSPRNVDVMRRGLEGRLQLRWPERGVRLGGGFSRARVVYDRPGPDTVQVRYRPRHTATIRAAWDHDLVRLGAEARYLGTRYPVPAPVNALDPFWSVDVDVGRSWRWSGWTLRTSLAVDRLLDRTDAFLFGFPEPGRTYELALDVRPPG